jgi:hypothetical protein
VSRDGGRQLRRAVGVEFFEHAGDAALPADGALG